MNITEARLCAHSAVVMSLLVSLEFDKDNLTTIALINYGIDPLSLD